MRYLSLLAAATLIAMTPASDVVVAPLVVEAGNDALRAAANTCTEQLVAALKLKKVAVTRDPQLTDENLRSAAAPWAIVGSLVHKDGQVAMEMRLLEAQSGDEMRTYFNSDKDAPGACRSVGRIAERIAAFVAEQKSSKQ